jgi:uncharacterized membrane protein YecN with MAPEG domain
MTTILPIAISTTMAAALINIWLAYRVGQVRHRHKVSVGDGGNAEVTARMRAHANFAEYAPIILILLALLELAQGSQWRFWLYGAAFVVARIAHGVGMDTWKPGRAIGIVLTQLVTLALVVECGIAVYGASPPSGAIAVEAVPAA